MRMTPEEIMASGIYNYKETIVSKLSGPLTIMQIEHDANLYGILFEDDTKTKIKKSFVVDASKQRSNEDKERKVDKKIQEKIKKGEFTPNLRVILKLKHHPDFEEIAKSEGVWEG